MARDLEFVSRGRNTSVLPLLFMTKYKFIRKIRVSSPHEPYFAKVELVFQLLKSLDPPSFKFCVKNLKGIKIVDKRGFYNKLDTKTSTWITHVGFFQPKFFNPKYLTSHLVHEAVHVMQDKEGKKNYGPKAEREAYLVQRKFLMKIKYAEGVKWLDEQYKSKWWENMPKGGV